MAGSADVRPPRRELSGGRQAELVICDQPIDITYLPMSGGFMYLAATIDWFSRYVVAWRLSNTLDGAFCRDMLDEALARRTPEVFNTDQGVQFTAQAWTDRVEQSGAAVSMDGRGRAADNVFVERLWRSVKYEDVYLKGYELVPELERGLWAYFAFYNGERLHQSLGYRTPAEVYRSGGGSRVNTSSGGPEQWR
jgi:putative transposase